MESPENKSWWKAEEQADAKPQNAEDLKAISQRLLDQCEQTVEKAKRIAADGQQLVAGSNVRWKLVAKWWAGGAVVAMVAIALILWNGHRLVDQGAVEGRKSTEQVERYLKEAAPMASSTIPAVGPTATIANAGRAPATPPITALLTSLGDPPSKATDSACAEANSSIRLVRRIEWPSAELMSKVQAWRVFTRDCQALAAAAKTAPNFERSIEVDGPVVVQSEVTSPPASYSRQSCVTNASAIRLIELDRLPVGSEVPKVLGWRGFIDACHRAAPEIWAKGGAAAVTAVAPWPPQSVTTETCVAGIPAINEGAQNLSPDKDDLPRLDAWHGFATQCLALTPAPFDGNYGSFVRHQPKLEPAPTADQATPETCAARLPIFNQLRLTASGQVEGIQEWNKFQVACQKLAEAGGASTSRVPGTPFNGTAAAPVSEPVASSATVRASSEGLAEVVPPVPPTATAQTCALGLDSLNRVHELKRALTVREQDWTQFGYACLGLSPAPLVADAHGYGIAQKPATKAAPAIQSEPVARTSAPKSAPSTPVAVATGSIDRATCEARLLDINSSNGKAVVDMTPAQRDAVGVASRCLASRLITTTRNGFVMAKGGGAITTTVTTSGSDGKKCVIKGAVVSQDGTPLPGATVSLTGQGIAVNATLTTDANGGWVSQPLPDGSVLAVFSADRHFSAKATLSTCSPVAQAPVSLETCNAFSCAARRLDEKLHLGGH